MYLVIVFILYLSFYILKFKTLKYALSNHIYLTINESFTYALKYEDKLTP